MIQYCHLKSWSMQGCVLRCPTLLLETQFFEGFFGVHPLSRQNRSKWELYDYIQQWMSTLAKHGGVLFSDLRDVGVVIRVRHRRERLSHHLLHGRPPKEVPLDEPEHGRLRDGRSGVFLALLRVHTPQRSHSERGHLLPQNPVWDNATQPWPHCMRQHSSLRCDPPKLTSAHSANLMQVPLAQACTPTKATRCTGHPVPEPRVLLHAGISTGHATCACLTGWRS